MSLAALSVDTMLPALSQIGGSLGVVNANQNQYIISTLFFGMASGLMLYGPLSDSYGRKSALYLGVFIFLVGGLVSIFSSSLSIMLFGRFLQGFGAASCRVVLLSMIRDKYQGKEMAKIMSLIMMFFIMVPALAPSIGQLLLTTFEWRSIFVFIFIVGLTGVIWLFLRQPETLMVTNRLPFSLATIFSGVKETLSNPSARYYTLAASSMFGAFVGYLSSSQQVFQSLYLLGDRFSLYFGVLALAIGSGSFSNTKLVMKYNIRALCIVSLAIMTATSVVFYFYIAGIQGAPKLLYLMMFLAIMLFCFGVLYGNMNALAIQPLGHIAGVANSVIGSIQTLISVLIGGFIGQSYNGTVQPLILGFVICSAVSLSILLLFTQKQQA